MKTRLLIILFVLVLIPVQLIYAPTQPNPKGVFDYAEHVIVGKILSVKILSKPDVQISENMGSIRAGIALYEIEVEEYLKNPMNEKVITVPGHYVDQEDPQSGFHLLYKVNQRVLLYIQADYPNTLVDYDLIISDSESRVLDGPVCNVGTSYHEGICISDNADDTRPLCEPIVDGICVNPDYGNFDSEIRQILLFASIGVIIGVVSFAIWRKRK